MVALGLWGDLFSSKPASADPKWTLVDFESRNSDDARRRRCAQRATVGRSDATWVEPSSGGAGHRRWSGLDLELGGRPFCGGTTTLGSLARATASMDGGPRPPLGR